MGSPFPGMDPWLESPSLWPDVHLSLPGVLREQLQPLLRPRFFVGVELRVYVLSEDDPAVRQVVPDMSVVAAAAHEPATTPVARASRGEGPAAATAEVVLLIDQLLVKEPRLVVRSLPDQQVVTVIELLSPSNKLVGSQSREEYLSRRREVLRSEVDLVEIDLLRSGARTPASTPLPAGDYMACVSRHAATAGGRVELDRARPDPASPAPPGRGPRGLDRPGRRPRHATHEVTPR